MANPFVHIELNTTDVDKAKDFYKQLFDWKLTDMEMGPSGTYTIIDVGGGTGGSLVVVRAIGPSLSSAGVQGALADPTLELHDANGATLATNDNWKINDLTQQSQEAEVQATLLAPTDDLESAIVTTLAPGPYTAVVRGKNETTGVALVEAYNLPNESRF